MEGSQDKRGGLGPAATREAELEPMCASRLLPCSLGYDPCVTEAGGLHRRANCASLWGTREAKGGDNEAAVRSIGWAAASGPQWNSGAITTRADPEREPKVICQEYPWMRPHLHLRNLTEFLEARFISVPNRVENSVKYSPRWADTGPSRHREAA